MKPTEHAICTAESVLMVVRMPGLDGALPRGYHSREVIWMNDIVGGPSSQLLNRLPEVFQELMVDELDLTCRCLDSDEPGNGVENQPKALFAAAQRLLSPLEFGSLLRFLERSLHGRRNSPKPGLKDIIGCSQLERFDRHFF